ncbi:hybrid sensor histidine kinase/response regulator [Radicibacter daui]|uniref:hybrid sensor histidine kinase/response regulator n=1 Tax=Radicibacter daui TaxID=3064829 RepID=UPI004046E7D7
MDDLLSEFLTETTENISVLDVELVRLEQNPNDPELLGNIFRLVHTIKGTCGFLGLPRLEAVAHAGENVLGKFRDGELEVTPEAVTIILEALDVIKALLGTLEATEQEPEGDDSDLIRRLNLMAEGKSPAAEAAKKKQAEIDAEGAGAKDSDELQALFDATPTDPEFVTKHRAAEPEPEPEPAPVATPAPVAKKEETAPAVRPAPAASAASAAPAGEPKESSVAQQSIRVNVDVLENLMTMVSELVLTRNQLMQILRSQKESEFAAPLQRLNHVTSELQEGVMKTRMQPIGNAWAKLPRLVRDLSIECHKKIDLQMLGADTELDRQVLDLIKDPLTHMVRNSADHGLETPDLRVAAGKPETGRITLNAYHEGGHIIIDISDDGRGLDKERIAAKAVQNGLASEMEIASMSDQQIYQFIFKAGFSTAAAVTSVSGRGVGMDVVRTNIEKIGGTIELKSKPGKGSTFIIKIPLTLAIVSALVVECVSERFAIPQISVVELVRAAANSEHKIENINNTSVLRLRNRLLPLVSLPHLLGLERDEAAPEETFIVVTQVGTYNFGIMVDRVFDTEEIVVKPVAPILRHIEMFSGNTILGDGTVIMILDPNGIAATTGEITVGDSVAAEAEASRTKRADNLMTLLLFSAGDMAPKAVPLSIVARLEDIDLKTVEYSNGQPLVQYRGKLMPLVPFDPAYQLEREGRKPVLVFADGERSMGLIVDEIVDIVEDRLNVELSGERPGLMGSAIIAGKATDVIDVGFYLHQAFADWFGTEDEDAFEQEAGKRVLLVDDSAFFRNLLAPLLKVNGYDVTAVESPMEALGLHEQGEDYDVIVTDIEMPGMSGFDFARKIRGDAEGRWRTTPMIALSSHATPRDFERGREVGFTDYVAKFDREALLQTLLQTLGEARAAAE